MKNIARITPQIVIKTKERLNYLQLLGVLTRHGYREWCLIEWIDWKTDYSNKFINALNNSGLKEFYKDMMNEISSQVNPRDSDDSDEAED